MKCVLSSTIHQNDLSIIVNLIKLAYENGYQNCVIDSQEEIFNNIGIYDSLQDALEVNESFTSKLIRDGFDGDDEHKEVEGVVIEPCQPSYTKNGSRVYLKKKTKRFLEKSGKPNIKHKIVEALPQEVLDVLMTACMYITKPRFEAVCSKIGEVTINDIGKVTGLTTKDIIDDMVKDGLVIPESKQFMKLLQKEVMTFVQPLLLLKD